MSGGYITVKTRRIVHKVMLADILFLDRLGRKVRIVTGGDDITYYANMSEIIPLLNDDFFGVLLWTYVNFSRVVCMSSGTITFDCGKTLMLARDSFAKAKLEFYRYLKSHEMPRPDTGETGRARKI